MAIRKEYNQSWSPYWLNMPDEGTKDYEDLDNKPSINDVELEGNKTGEELGIHKCECDPLTNDQINQLLEIL